MNDALAASEFGRRQRIVSKFVKFWFGFYKVPITKVLFYCKVVPARVPALGKYDPETKEVHISLLSNAEGYLAVLRLADKTAINDVLNTAAEELWHYKQDLDGKHSFMKYEEMEKEAKESATAIVDWYLN